jgi:hypothetical protein
MPIPALAPALSPLLEVEEEEVAVGLAAEELAVRVIDKELEAMDVDVVDDGEADAVVFGFCWVTVRLARTKYP